MTQAYGNFKAAWHTEKIDELRKGNDIIPVHVQLILSDLCNQDCHFCSYRMSNGFSSENFADENGNKNPKRFIPIDKALEILKDCSDLGVKAIEFTGGGEPTVHPDFCDILKYAQDIGLETGLVTNGVLLKDNEVYRNLDWLRISLDAGKPSTYEEIRKSKQWHKVTNNIVLASSFEKPYFGVGFVITRENYMDLVYACAFIKGLGASYIRLSAMFSYEGAEYYDGIYDRIVSDIKHCKSLEDDNFRVIDFFGARVSDLEMEAPDYSFCGEQQFVLYIGGDQKVYTCCTNAYTTHGEIGDLRLMSFAEWIGTHRRFDFDARGCHHCQFNDKNKIINYLLDTPTHVNFV